MHSKSKFMLLFLLASLLMGIISQVLKNNASQVAAHSPQDVVVVD